MERITPEEYAHAVIAGLKFAQRDTGGSRIMAQVLLSAYNGDAFQLDVASLSGLDQENYQVALKIIRGRYEVFMEPHETIQNGSKVFSDLWTQWGRLELTERAKKACPACDGRGKIYLNPDDDNDMSSEPCSRCSGSGRVCNCN